MFKPGDKFNPYDPAAFDLGPDGPQQRAAGGTSPMSSDMLKNPSQMEAILKMMLRESAAERERTGETPQEQMMREKREWAEADAKSAQLKSEGNDAFKAGDYQSAFVLYTACMHLSGHEPLYFLNRAAVALKLKLYKTAAEDALLATKKGDYNAAKAHFRRGQAKFFLGDWTEAEKEYQIALELQPGDPSILERVDELKKVQSLSADEQAAWIAAQKPTTESDIFGGPGTLQRKVKEVLNR
ncbi:serine/threonine protein phosphatase 5 [Favolaschia claudopus]|uniref:Serine/threonine protein phosphatase 5 n=1 Tax=Favolaschia claudopus TaxID=2862362 RepID=A0AAW0A566_9AGAR